MYDIYRIETDMGELFPNKQVVLLQSVNCMGVLEGFLNIRNVSLYPCIYESYLEFLKSHEPNRQSLLGKVHLTALKPGLTVVSVFTQLRTNTFERQTNYEAMYSGLKRVDSLYKDAIIVVPYMFGCGLSGGDWRIIESMLDSIFDNSSNLMYVIDSNIGR